MSGDVKPKHIDICARVWLAVIMFIIAIMIGRQFLQSLREIGRQPRAVWEREGIRIVCHDGPWMLTHLVTYSSGYWQAVASLPQPVTVLESSGHFFSREEIDRLIWFDISGGKQAPPKVGEQIGVMYLIPNEN